MTRPMRWVLVAAIAACGGSEPEPVPCDDCDALFGRPSDATGLEDGMCAPTCGAFAPPSYDAVFIDALRTPVLLDPPARLVDDPYADAPPPRDADAVCAVTFVDAATYRLDTFADATSVGDVTITHHGACGLCSSLHDLAVYAGTPDLTEPVRACGIEGFTGGKGANVACLEALGFSGPCADIWYFNTNNTRDVCLDVCLSALDAPHHDADGAPNACIQCDEDNSGPVFKAIAGRTRRNSGLPTALCRPCSSVAKIIHDHP